MTKEDIKEALKTCGSINSLCVNCPYKNVENCYDTLNNDARELITEQEEEIERLNEVIKNYKEVLCETTQRKDDAIKLNDKLVDEYENKIKQAQIDVLKRLKVFSEPYPNSWGIYVIDVYHIDELIKEVENDK